MARCTVPKWFGLQDWFDARFLDLCEAHDQVYQLRIWREKVQSDFILASAMAARGHALLGFFTIIFTSTFGSIYWMWKKYK